MEGMDAKTRLNQFCQKYCLRPVTKKDILYSTTKFGHDQYQAIVRLNCMEGQEYAGELRPNPKEAEKSAAQQAMVAYAAVISSLPPMKPGGKKKKSAGAAGAAGGAAGGEEKAKKKLEDGENPALTDKVKLNALCMRIAKRPLQKGDTVYDTRQMGLGKAAAGYQTTVRLPCLPGDWAAKMFAGQVCTNKQAAEQSAAGIALAAMIVDPVLVEAAAKAPPAKAGGEGKKGGGKGWKGWWGPMPTGPDLPREEVTTAPVSGTVVEWKGNFGWVQPTEPLDHPAAKKRSGKVYLHKQDLKDGKEALEEGATVLINVYVDATGLGGIQA
eukprot:gb/GFBE01000416.1/.p1 GENE.gb/GFBE01000416.1/~~gb/GFBE01000416.1/.p1  ORF type:complete len:326 (+),score=98.78 gb/GFBE01000416.1/:1-978(+)